MFSSQSPRWGKIDLFIVLHLITVASRNFLTSEAVKPPAILLEHFHLPSQPCNLQIHLPLDPHSLCFFQVQYEKSSSHSFSGSLLCCFHKVFPRLSQFRHCFLAVHQRDRHAGLCSLPSHCSICPLFWTDSQDSTVSVSSLVIYVSTWNIIYNIVFWLMSPLLNWNYSWQGFQRSHVDGENLLSPSYSPLRLSNFPTLICYHAATRSWFSFYLPGCSCSSPCSGSSASIPLGNVGMFQGLVCGPLLLPLYLRSSLMISSNPVDLNTTDLMIISN